MDILERLNYLEKSEAFSKWKKENPEFFLSHIFVMFDNLNKDIIQCGYYSPKIDRIITFVVQDGEIVKSGESEVFRHPDKNVKEFERDKIKISLDQAYKIMEDFQKKEYPNQSAVKSFVIIQNIDEGMVYNFTYMTPTFYTLNVKVSCETGEVVSHLLHSLIKGM